MGGAVLLAGCQQGFDYDLRPGSGLSTAEAARSAVANRPLPDSRGVISYPNYQVAVAQRGDTVRTVAARLGMSADQLAQYNATSPDQPLDLGAVVALPARVSAAPIAGAQGAGAPISGGTIDVTSLASNAINRAQSTGAAAGGIATTAIPAPVATAAPAAAAAPATAPGAAGPEPVRHRVARGESAYTIARAYNVPVRSLAEWNGLSGDMTVREGQYLLIPVALATAPSGTTSINAPGTGSATPLPPSASAPLPADTPPAASSPSRAPAAAGMGTQQTAASSGGRFTMPVQGSIIRSYSKGKNDGIDISAAAGTAVRAADGGTVAAITRDTDQVPIMVIRHPNNLLTVYANIDGITVAKGATVTKGQTIAKVRAGSQPFVHFEVRDGYNSVDPMRYLQ
ncbi:M23 family metallopeptidase [Frigidibacter sp. MR17.24]|uniref:M23 family metallopeptidase n=1 Tax=Frigidibacter sp. MR17.24 TaxID=3127345 RepID=UPI003012DAF0